MSNFSEGQTHIIMDRFEAERFSPLHITKLGQSRTTMQGLRGVLDGTHEIRPIEHILDLGAAAQMPFSGTVLEHHRGTGIVKVEHRADGIYLGERRIGGLFRAKAQKKGTIIGHDLRKETEKRTDMLPAILLDFCVEHPKFWPEEWKKDAEGNTLYVFFWDDIFRSPAHGHLYVRYGYWSEGTVISSYRWLGNDFSRGLPAAAVGSLVLRPWPL